ncbi:GtrA family protein [Clostridia bacterium OttesenSCG-928-F22]|nr:GtrA family protein [Clostridia bacterium OttesenSCG-928-F22]
MGFLQKIIRHERFMELFRFAITGGVSSLVNWGITAALKELLLVDVIIASMVGFTISVVVNYLMSVLWVFKEANRKDRVTAFLFIITSVIGLGLNTLFMWLFVDVAGIHYMVSLVLATILVMGWNYITKRKAVTMQRNRKTDNKA